MSEGWLDRDDGADVLEVEDDRLEEEEHVHELPLDEQPLTDEASDTPAATDHAGGELEIPGEVNVIEGEADGTRRGVAIVPPRFDRPGTTRLPERGLAE